MACSCKTRLGKKEAPHAVTPGESCIFCAEKHLGEAVSAYVSMGFGEGSRQYILGELECARRHSRLAWQSVAASVTDALVSGMTGKADFPARLQGASEMAASYAERAGSEDRSDATYIPASVAPGTAHPLIGELLFGAAWRLADECGYWRTNRPLIIGDLAGAQFHFLRHDRELADLLRDWRHAIQRQDTDSGSTVWSDLARRVHASVSPVLFDITATYGTDFWYFDK